MSVSIDPGCKEKMQAYEHKYGGYNSNGKFPSQERLAYLSTIKGVCKGSAFFYVYKARVLFVEGQYDDSISVLDNGLRVNARPRGNLLLEKASALRDLRSSGIQTEHGYNTVSYDFIVGLYNEALNAENTVKPLIYLGLGETLVLKGDYDNAMKALSAGSKLDPIPRFFTLGAVVQSKRKDYVKVAKLIEVAIHKDGENYLTEPDSVLAIATALCHLQRNDLAKNIVEKSRRLLSDIPHNPDLLAASKVVRGCKISVIVKDKLY